MKKSPLFIYSTRIGAYYHLTPFNQQKLNLDTCLLSAGDFFHMENTLKKLQSETKMSFRQYINQENKTLYMSSIDTYKMKCVERSSNWDGVKITQLGGNKFIKNQQYNNLARLINPDILVSLTEQLDFQTGQNSIKRSSQKSAKFLKESLNELKDTQISIFGAIQGGLQTDQKIIAAETQRFAVDYPNFKGLTLYGFNQGSSWKDKENAISVVQSVYDDYNLQYILAGQGEILTILWGISWGIKGFEVEEPFRFAQDLKALILLIKINLYQKLVILLKLQYYQNQKQTKVNLNSSLMIKQTFMNWKAKKQVLQILLLIQMLKKIFHWILIVLVLYAKIIQNYIYLIQLNARR